MSQVTSPRTARAICRTELYWLVGAVVFGSILRLSFPGRMAVEHFDEGVYASNFWFGAEDEFSYPARYLYAPPLLPAVIEWTMILASLCGFTPTGFVPMIPCLIAGIAMIPSIWWVCRQWFGPTAGLVSAWIVASSDFHASYSRAALTDVPVCLFMLWAVYFTGRAFIDVGSAGSIVMRAKKSTASVRGSLPWREIGLAGLFTGLAWWTKYNGWLPLAIGFTAGVIWQMRMPRVERQIQRILICWILIAAIAIAVWSPVLWGLQKHGGYATVAANHRQYLVSGRGWANSAVTQLYNIGFYDDPFDIYKPLAGVPKLAVRPAFFFQWNAGSSFGFYRTLAGNGEWRLLVMNLVGDLFRYVAPLLIPLGSLLLSATICAVVLMRTRQPSLLWSVSLIASWFAGLTVATPFYYPYPRLVLPWLCATWICTGLAAQTWNDRKRENSGNSSFEFATTSPKILILIWVAICVCRLGTGSAQVWKDRTGVQKAAEKFAARIRQETSQSGFPENEAIVYVLGDPAIVFGLKAQGMPAVGPAQGLGFMQRPILRPTFVAFPPRDSAMSQEDREELSSYRFERVDGSPSTPSHLVVLDELGSPSMSVESAEMKLFRLIK